MNMHEHTSQTSIKDVMRLHDIDEVDLEVVRKYGALVVPRMGEYITHFYEWMRELPEYQTLFANDEVKKRAQNAQLTYWKTFFAGHLDDSYMEDRRRLGETHARIGLSLPSYFAGMNYSFVLFTKKLYDGGLFSEEYGKAVAAITKLLHLDTTIVVETYSRLINERINEQSRALMEMSTPVTMIWQDILMLPVVGIIDSKRAQDIMAAILLKIAETRSRVFIMDISGVAIVDSGVANHLIKITKATRLMGCTSLISGVSPSIAQTIVHLGIDIEGMTTHATLRDALEQAFKSVGIRMKRLDEV
ncbi:STAS domain-containing protein [Iodobacter sp. HSC-16F04]|uniref:STAS domain-containing protein n=2 Tax=Iodobacter violaceini TaxID=3044271 RepID=A0ABX0KMY8_9NEIS|nr:STAS domain-containing protein [Iodobacter violacea]